GWWGAVGFVGPRVKASSEVVLVNDEVGLMAPWSPTFSDIPRGISDAGSISAPRIATAISNMSDVGFIMCLRSNGSVFSIIRILNTRHLGLFRAATTPQS